MLPPPYLLVAEAVPPHDGGDLCAAAPLATRIWHKRADRPMRSRRTALAIWLAARWLDVPMPWSVIRQTNGTQLLAWEVQRLHALAAAGEIVPDVIAYDGHELQTRDLGPTLDHVLSGIADHAEQLRLMCAASADLAGFHARGHWHGGSQIRNLTWDGMRFGRIDFEEPLHPALPLATVQAYDLLQLLLSMVRWLHACGDGAVDEVLRHYAQAHPTQAVVLRTQLRGWLPRLQGLQGVIGWRPRWRRSREHQRLGIVVAALESFIYQNYT